MRFFRFWHLLTACWLLAGLSCIDNMSPLPEENSVREQYLQLRKDLAPVPLPETRDKIYITLDNQDKIIYLPGVLLSGDSRDPSGGALLKRVWSLSDYSFYKAAGSGYANYIAVSGNKRFKVDLFISPVDSVHSDRQDMDWYQTQFNSGTTSNCGPTVVAMGIGWAIGKRVTVKTIRDIIGWTGNGAVSFYQMKAVLKKYGIESEIREISSPEEIFPLIDRDHIVGILYNMNGVSYTKNAGQNLFGQYYVDKGGHYLAIKGYSADKKYFIIYDPIPSDWLYNGKRYRDGTSMYGRNRYYKVDELFAAMISRNILEIKR